MVRRTARASPPADRGALVDRSRELAAVGPTFLSVVRYRELLKNLVLKDIKLKYRGSVLGFLWSLANPIALIVVYTAVFTALLGIRGEGFALFVLLGILAWTFFTGSVTMSAVSIADSGDLVNSVFFPRAILPTATVLFNLAQYGLTVLILLPVMLLIYRVPPAPVMLLFPVVLALQVVFTIGVALILATVTVFFRDVRHFIELALMVLFWMTPIVYDLRDVPEHLQLPILLNPMSSYVAAYHSLFYYRQAPEPITWVLGTAYACGALVAGGWIFHAFQDRFAEQV